MENIEDPSIHRNPSYCRARTNWSICLRLLFFLENHSHSELREATKKHPWGFIATRPDAGQLITLLLKLLNAKETIELGVFTGYSLLLTALSIPEDGKPANFGTFDFAYIDNDEGNYVNYHERLIKRVKVGGLLVYDNTLWGGRVALPEEKVPMHSRPGWQGATQFNNAIIEDSSC